jgi:hypothetical protein
MVARVPITPAAAPPARTPSGLRLRETSQSTEDASGEFAPDTNSELVAAALLGAIFCYRLMSPGPLFPSKRVSSWPPFYHPHPHGYARPHGPPSDALTLHLTSLSAR